MSTLSIFRGTGDVGDWVTSIKAKLLSKGYRNYLLDKNRPDAGPELAAWNAQADKAVGVILTYLDPSLVVVFEDKSTPQSLLEAIAAYYRPDMFQEVSRLEDSLMNLTYDGSDPVAWCANVRHMITKLTVKGAKLLDRTVKILILKALEQEPEYKIRVEMIRYSNSNISLEDLWVAIAKLPYPVVRAERAFAAMKLTDDSHRMQKRITAQAEG